MANRLSLKDRKAQDARGVDAIITFSKETEETSPDDERNERSEQNEQAVSLAKVTIYIRPDQVLSIEEIQLAERKRTGKRKDKSELMQEALDLLIQGYRKA